MIVTVTPNIALDVTYNVDELTVHGSHRVSHFSERAGGKGINVSRVLGALGYPSTVLGFCGGINGATIQAELDAAGMTNDLVPIGGNNRRSITVVDEATGDATVFNEAGPTVTPAQWSALVARVDHALEQATVLVVSGSFPPGVDDDACVQLVQLANARGVPVIVDTVGRNLLAAVDAGVTVIKPNAAEIIETTGTKDVIEAARELNRRGAGAVVVSMGPDGMLAVTKDKVWQATPPKQVSGNPTGAGDAAVAALAAGVSTNTEWPNRLKEAVAVSAAAVLYPLAGGFDREAYEDFRTNVRVEEVNAAIPNG